jgi:putative transposase
MRELLRFEGKVKSAVVSRTADRWFVSLSVEIEHVPPVRENQAVVGVDLGIKTLATLSDDTPPIESPKALKWNLKRLKRLSRSLCRKVKGSANRHLARAVADVGMSEFGRQLTYKAALHGTRVVMVDRWFPSSKTCSDCGHVRAGLTLSEREWSCDACGVIHDRDRNAAINLKNFAANLCGDTAEFSAVTACGDEGSDVGPATAVKPASVKQEPEPEAFAYV